MPLTGATAREHLPRGLYSFHPAVIESGRGCRLITEDGRELLDLTSGLGVLALGHGDARLLEAMERQLHRLSHLCAHVALHRPYLDLTDRLDGLFPGSGPSKTFLVNSGAEAVENAVKIARHATGRRAVLAMDGAYHGRTLLGTSLTSRAHPYRRGHAPLAPEIHHVPYAYCYRCPWGLAEPDCALRCLEALERFFFLECPSDEVAALVVEPIQGEGGVVVPPDAFLRGLREICTRHGILFIADEVQTGLGRTGELFAMDYPGVAPDLMVLGKALGGGLPLAAVTGPAQFMDAPHASALGSTFGGNPLACAAAGTLIQVLQDDGLCARAREIFSRFEQRSAQWRLRFPRIGDIRGRGAMLGLELIEDPGTREPAPRQARALVRACRERGLLIVSGGLYRNVLRLLPPLTIPWEDWERAMDILEDALAGLP
jgi:4-aminobutyrate aminotransferase/(S)-3-amino-2-methylpropionate transaminase